MSPIKMERIEGGIRTVIAYVDRFNAHDVDGLLTLFADSCILEDPLHFSGECGGLGKEGIADYYRNRFQGLKECKLEIVELAGMGMRCILRWKLTWNAENGRRLLRHGVSMFRFSNAKVVEILEYVKERP